MDFLYEFGINNETINSIIKHNGEGITLSFISNEEEIINIIKYFISIGIKDIDSLLIYKVDLFLEDLDKIKEKITWDMVNAINSDFTIID